MKIKEFKNGAYVSFERAMPSGYYIVKAYAPNGALMDKVICDDYRNAVTYRKCFEGMARQA